jgi:hypothetical protein
MTVVGRMVPWRRWLALRCGGGFRLCPQRTRDHRRGCTARAPGMAARPQRSVLDQRATGPGFLTTTTPPEVEGPRGPASRAAEGLLRLHVLRTYVVSGGAARLGYRRVGAGPDVHPSIRICRDVRAQRWSSEVVPGRAPRWVTDTRRLARPSPNEASRPMLRA